MINLFLFLLSLLFINQVHAQQESPTTGYIPIGKDSLYYESYGSGEPVVILHGGPGLDRTYLLPQFKQLANNYRLIFYDQRASGNSSGNIDSLSITPAQFVEDLESLRKELKLEQMNLLGHSWGGLLAMEYAMKYPGHLQSLILISSVGATSEYIVPFLTNRETRRTPKDSAEIVRLMRSPAVAIGDITAIQNLCRIFFKSYFYNQSLSSQLTLSFTPSTAQHFFPILTLIMSHYIQYNYLSELGEIHSPTLVIHGDYDPIPYRYARQISESIPGAKFVLLKNCGHFPFIEASDQFFTECAQFWEARH